MIISCGKEASGMKKIILGMFLLIGIGCFSLYKPKDEKQVLKEEAINLSNLVGVYIQNGDSKSDRSHVVL